MDGEVLGNQTSAMTMPKRHPNLISPSETGAFLYPNSICQNLVRKKMGFMTRWNHKPLENIDGDPTGTRNRLKCFALLR